LNDDRLRPSTGDRKSHDISGLADILMTLGSPELGVEILATVFGNTPGLLGARI